ncbi:MAG: hypothetical protein FJ303_04505 [Planctomycetes bacterium]|nr:hypothetical protein [Planctomycetota bacterium]
MNTVGKILVILNFIFAMAVGGFLVFDFALRTQWKERYHALNTEANALKQSRDVTESMMAKVTADYRQVKEELEKEKQKQKDLEVAKIAKELEFDTRMNEMKAQLDDKGLSETQAKELAKRLAGEVDILKVTIRDREGSIVGLEQKVREIRTAVATFEALARTRQIQNENLLQQVRDLTKEVARLEAGITSDRAPTSVSNPNEARPPVLMLNGKIERVEGQFVQLSLGTDQGLKENNTLEVYRLYPSPKYLGMIRVIDAKAHSSVARLVLTSTATPPVLREGDLVTSKLSK